MTGRDFDNAHTAHFAPFAANTVTTSNDAIRDHCISFSIFLLHGFQIMWRSRRPRAAASATASWRACRIDCGTVCMALGVELGDRVGICMRKSADAVASIFGIMKAGAAYVPADPTAPASRNAFIFHNCAVKVVIVEARLADRLGEEFNQVGFAPEMIVIEEPELEFRSPKLSTGWTRSARLPLCRALFPTHRDWLTSSTLQAQPVGQKVLCCRTAMPSASSIGAPTCFSPTSMIDSHRMLHFISICRFLTSMCRSNTARHWCWSRSNWVRNPRDWHRGLPRRRSPSGTPLHRS